MAKNSAGEALREDQAWAALECFLDTTWEMAHEYDRYAVDNYLLLGLAAVRHWSFSGYENWPSTLDQRYEELVEMGFVADRKARDLVHVTTARLSTDSSLRLAGDCPEVSKLHAVQRYWKQHYFFPRVEMVGEDVYHAWLGTYAELHPVPTQDLRKIEKGASLLLAVADVRMVPLTALDAQIPKPGYRRLNQPTEFGMIVPPHVRVEGEIGGAILYDWGNMSVLQDKHHKDIAEFPGTRQFLKDHQIAGYAGRHDLTDKELELQLARASSLS